MPGLGAMLPQVIQAGQGAGAGVSVPCQPTPDGGAGPANPPPAMEVDRPTLADVLVDGIQNGGGQLPGFRHRAVHDGEPLVGLHPEPFGVGITLALLGQVDEGGDAGLWEVGQLGQGRLLA